MININWTSFDEKIPHNINNNSTIQSLILGYRLSYLIFLNKDIQKTTFSSIHIKNKLNNLIDINNKIRNVIKELELANPFNDVNEALLNYLKDNYNSLEKKTRINHDEK